MKVNDAANRRGLNEEMFGMVLPFLGFSRQWGKHRNSKAIPRGSATIYIGGVSPSRPTLTRLVSKVPSGSFFMTAITLAPAFRSDLSAGT